TETWWGYGDVVELSGVTGNVLLTTSVFNNMLGQVKKNSDNATTYTYGGLNGPAAGQLPYEGFGINGWSIGGNYLLAGTYAYDIRKPLVRTEKTYSEWQLVFVSPQGNASMFKYRGSGKYMQNGYTGDGESNILDAAAPGTNNDFFLEGNYLTGEFSARKNTGVDHSVTMAINLATHKILWKQEQAGESFWLASYMPTNKALLAGANSYNVHDGATGAAGTSITYPGTESGIAYDESYESIMALNSTPGILYQIVGDNGNAYFAKYSLSSGVLSQPRLVNNLQPQGDHELTFQLNQNYPNPFNPTTTIRYSLPQDSKVTLEIFTVLGQRVRTLVDGNETTGEKSVSFDASRLPSGVYFYRLSAVGATKEFRETKRLAVVK
ncbi:MAG TPA: T9SS type A sorting domain-containing protein, partial [Bacteroidota bacterium]|nr:T9SS type A sorting domain-containing protein [Bacteroidota bacterium]